MKGLKLVVTLACVTGAAATLAATSPKSAAPQLPASSPAPVAATVVPANRPADLVRWMTRYGTYNARQGSWSLLPQESWSFLPNPDGC